MSATEESIASIRCIGATYSWLASFYLTEPTFELFETLHDPTLKDVLSLIFMDANSQRVQKELLVCADKTSIEEAKEEFYSLFVTPIHGNFVPPYESCFREKEGENYGNLWGETTAKVLKFYHEAGFEAKTPPQIFAPDHLGVELAFMTKLCSLELSHLTNHKLEKAERVRTLRGSFLKDHLCNWIKDFSEAVKASPSSNFYGYIALLTKHLVQLDSEDLLPFSSDKELI